MAYAWEPPDWKYKAGYPDPCDGNITWADWAWEFLRRNEHYNSWWRIGESNQDIVKIKFGIERLVDPSLDCTKAWGAGLRFVGIGAPAMVDYFTYQELFIDKSERLLPSSLTDCVFAFDLAMTKADILKQFTRALDDAQLYVDVRICNDLGITLEEFCKKYKPSADAVVTSRNRTPKTRPPQEPKIKDMRLLLRMLDCINAGLSPTKKSSINWLWLDGSKDVHESTETITQLEHRRIPEGDPAYEVARNLGLNEKVRKDMQSHLTTAKQHQANPGYLFRLSILPYRD